MQRNKPKFKYNGLTIILSNPNRHEGKKLMEGTGAYFFDKECLSPETNQYCCDIRLIQDKSELLPNTKAILLLGQRAFTEFTGSNLSLDEGRGSPYTVDGIVSIPSFTYQDAVDPKDFESKFNKAATTSSEFEDEETDESDVLANKGRGRTDRANYRFWLKSDTKKILRVLENDGKIPEPIWYPDYILCPSLEDIVDVLSTTKKSDLYLDLETDFYSIDLRCFACAFPPTESNIVKVYIVPVLDIDYKPFYGEYYRLIKALAIAIRDNCVTSHNGAVFDWFVMAFKYGLAVGKNLYDTLVAQHRIFPDIEKSLGHCISYWTYLPFHKNEGIHDYRTLSQAEQLWRYCGKDVYSMMLVKQAQLKYARNDPGLMDSINQAMSSLRPYLITTLLGMKFDDKERQKWINESDRLMLQYMRIMKILHGPKVEMLISNKKCVEYFHNQMGYPAVKRTAKGNPSLAADALLKLRAQHDNPIIPFLLKYRQKQKETGILNFKVWKEKNETNKTTN